MSNNEIAFWVYSFLVWILGFMIIALLEGVQNKGPNYIPLGFVPWGMIGPIASMEIVYFLHHLSTP